MQLASSFTVQFPGSRERGGEPPEPPENRRATVSQCERAAPATSATMPDWEIQLAGKWTPLGVVERGMLEQAQQDGLKQCKAKVRGYEYVYDLDALTQTNTATGRVRRLRCMDPPMKPSFARLPPLALVSRSVRSLVRSFTMTAVPVKLHIYNVGCSATVKTLNSVLRLGGSGIYHAAVEIYGLEWSYGYAQEGSGVFWCEPTHCEMHQYRECKDLGTVRMSKGRVDDLLDTLAQEWSGADYDLLRRNCCHFCAEFARRLGCSPVPSWVLHAAGTGAKLDDIVAKGGSSIGTYRFGDVTRGILAIGREADGRSPDSSYRCGDCTRGMFHVCCR